MKDGFSPPVFMGAGYSRGQRRGWGREGWVPASARTTGGGELVGQSNLTGDHKGRPYGEGEGMGEGGMDSRMREDNGRGAKGMGSRLRGKNGWGRWG